MHFTRRLSSNTIDRLLFEVHVLLSFRIYPSLVDFQAKGITDPGDIIFRTSREERRNFYPTIASGLNRPLFSVYRRVKRLYDHTNHKGR